MAITLTARQTAPRDIIATTLRLLWIEVRRGAAPFVVPVLVLLAWWDIHISYERDDADLFWASASMTVAEASKVMAILAAGLLAWQGGREDRRQIDDLLTTTPTHAIRRDLAHWGAGTAWVLAAYAAFACVELIPVALTATWGGPEWSVLLLGAVAIATAAAIGYAAGVVLPSRFTPPLVTGLLFVITVVSSYPLGRGSSVDTRLLMPYQALSYIPTDAGLYYRFDTPLVGRLTLWMVAVAVVAMATVALWRTDTKRTRQVVAAAVAVAATLAVSILAAGRGASADRFTGRSDPSRLVAYDPICRTTSIEVCVHPAFSSLLTGYAVGIGSMVEPLLGVPGGPVRASSAGNEHTTVTSDGTLAFVIPMASPGPDRNALASIVHTFVSVQELRFSYYSDGTCYALPTDAQYVVQQVLLNRATGPVPQRFIEGFGPLMRFLACDWPEVPGASAASPDAIAVMETRRAEIEAAIVRFGALPLDQQRAWFTTNLIPLRAGRLTLVDLP